MTKAGLDEGYGNEATDNPVPCMKTTETAVNGRSASTNYETTKIEGPVTQYLEVLLGDFDQCLLNPGL